MERHAIKFYISLLGIFLLGNLILINYILLKEAYTNHYETSSSLNSPKLQSELAQKKSSNALINPNKNVETSNSGTSSFRDSIQKEKEIYNTKDDRSISITKRNSKKNSRHSRDITTKSSYLEKNTENNELREYIIQERNQITTITDGLSEIKEIVANDNIQNVELNQKIVLLGEIPDTATWIKADSFWSFTKGRGIKIAVLDSGISPHNDLRIAGGVSFVGGSYYDEFGHGTQVAGIISALLDNNGIVGVAPEADLYAVKITNNKEGDLSTAIQGLQWSTDNNMDIIVMPFGFNDYSQIFKDLVEEAYGKGIVLIAASGNDGKEGIKYPAKYDNVIAVGSINENNEKASLSNFGQESELVAPGIVNTTTLDNNYTIEEGTSYSAAYVTGVAALLKSFNASWNNTQIRSILHDNAIDLGKAGRDDYYGYGLVQANLGANAKIVEPNPNQHISQPVIEKPVIDKPVIEPVINNPIIDKQVPVIKNRVIKNPVIENPIIENPVIDKPIIDKPIIDKPIIDKPIIDKPVPIIDNQVIDKQIIDTHVIEEPVINKPSDNEQQEFQLLGNNEFRLEYDAVGNLISSISNNYEYDEFNQLRKVKDKAGRLLEEYFYDDTGARIKKIDYKLDGTKITSYYPDINFVSVIDNSGTYNTIFYYDGARLVGRRDSDGSIKFYHTDHLGSTSVVTDLAGNVVEKTTYEPFGAVLEGGKSRFLFTGKEKDFSGLYYYGARYYDPLLAHFTQADTVIGDVYDPLSLNRYAYARNNPLKYTDPSGNWIQIPFIGLISGVISAGWNTVTQIWHGASLFKGTVRWGSVRKSFVRGFAGGAIGMSTARFVSPLFRGTTGLSRIAGLTATGLSTTMMGSVGYQVTSNLLSGQPVTSNVYESAVSGAKWGGAIGLGGGLIGAFKSSGSNVYIGGKVRNIQNIPINKLSPTQDLLDSDYGKIYDLRRSISMEGFRIGEAVPYLKVGDEYALINGHHRAIAITSLGKRTIPAFEITKSELPSFRPYPKEFYSDFNSFKHQRIEDIAKYFR